MRAPLVFAAVVALAGVLQPDTAQARRIVIDIGSTYSFDGYCSRQQSGIPGGDCEPVELPFALNLGGTMFNTVVAHSNGALSFGTALEFDQFSNSLRDFSTPIFSPFLRNGEGSSEFDRDGDFVAQLVVESNNLSVNWFSCTTSNTCFRNNFGLFLTRLSDGFSVDFTYGPDGPTINGLSGYNLPTGSFETFGALRNQSFTFDANGSPLASAVPEPGTWAMMIIGFGMTGSALRRRRSAFGEAAA